VAFPGEALHDCGTMPAPFFRTTPDRPLPTFPRLRTGLSISARDGQTLVFSARPESFEAIDDADGNWAALLRACDCTLDLQGVRLRLAREGVELSPDALAQGIDALTLHGLLVDASGDVPDEWSSQRAYLEQLTRGEIDVASAQARVRRSRVLILGAGGIGSWLAQALAMMGVAELVVVDPDRVEERNRTRQPYPADSVGRRKVEVLGEMVTRLRPGLEFTGVDLRVEHESDLSSLVEQVDVVASCADEPSVEIVAALVARVCLPARVPHIIAAYNGPVVRVGPFWHPRRRPLPCHGCLALARDTDDRAFGLTSAELAAAAPGGRRSAVSAAQSQVVAALVAGEILHLRAGVPPATAGRVAVLDLLTLKSHRSRVPVRDDCALCSGGKRRRVAVASGEHASLERG
jgi:bacteriocin biosynthesis cyclodehydratase domain-containing protein